MTGFLRESQRRIATGLHVLFPAALCCALLVRCGCGGGGGKPVLPTVVVNRIGLTKMEADPGDLALEELTDVGNRSNCGADKVVVNGETYYYSCSFVFAGSRYTVRIPIANWVSLFDAHGSEVSVLELPRYSRSVGCLEIRGSEGQRLLAIYVDQQSTSDSSTLFLLSESLEVVYTEYLAGAKWMAKTAHGECERLVVSTEEYYWYAGARQRAGGPWLYDPWGCVSQEDQSGDSDRQH